MTINLRDIIANEMLPLFLMPKIEFCTNDEILCDIKQMWDARR